MLDEGCGDRSALDVHEALGRIGAQLDLDVGHDATVLGLTTLERYLDRGLELVRDMLIRPRFEQREFDRVRDLRLNRLLQMKDMPPALADRAFTQLLYRNHPYGHLPIGSEGRAAGADDPRHHRVPSPRVRAGADDGHRGRRRVARALLGRGRARVRGLDARSRPSRSPIPDAFPAAVAAADAAGRSSTARGAAQSELRIGHVALPRRSPDYHGALVANMILGGQFVSRINMNLREDKGYTYGARTAFEFRRAPGPFVLHASVQARRHRRRAARGASARSARSAASVR